MISFKFTSFMMLAAMNQYNVDATITCPSGLVAKVDSSGQDYCAYKVADIGYYPYEGCYKDDSDSGNGRAMQHIGDTYGYGGLYPIML